MASVLLVTIPPFVGGVPYKARVLARYLRDQGHTVTVAYYATYSDHPDLVATSWQVILGKRPSVSKGTCFEDFPSVAIGCVLPELEFTYYLTSKRWRDVIAAHDRHIAVGGTVLVSNPLTEVGVPHLVWCASTMIEDRIDRRRAMPFARQIIDRLLIGPVQRRMERKILRGPGHFMTVSDYTRNTLLAAGGAEDRFTRLPIPIDMDAYAPPSSGPRPGIIGFAGRPGDPRKNLQMLFKALTILIHRGRDIELHLTGEPTPELKQAADGMAGHIHWHGWLDDAALADFFRSLDVFAIPSYQEGLNIAGLQAMSSGVPVVSTRCGGPEDYVVDGVTGYLSDFKADIMADKIDQVVGDRLLRDQLGQNARAKVAEQFSFDVFDRQLSSAWNAVWRDQP